MDRIEDISNSIVSKLKKDFHRNIFKDAMAVLDVPINTKFSNFANTLRELTRLLLKELAPDEEILKCNWFEKQYNQEGEVVITRIQRMTYAIKGGLSKEFIDKELEIDFEDITVKLNKVIAKLNKYIHFSQKLYLDDHNEGYKMVKNALVAFEGFLDSISNLRNKLIRQLEDILFSKVSDEITGEMINEIDILATHYWVDGVSIDKIMVCNITSQEIQIVANGNVEVEHQYGSDRDFRTGDGLRMEASYPFQMFLVLDVNFPFEANVEHRKTTVDNSSFYE